VLCDLLSKSSTATVEVVETRYRGSATESVAERSKDVDRVIAVGGDGTLNEVLGGLLGSGSSGGQLPALGFLPSGTANAAVRAFGFNSDPAAVARALPEVEVRPVDVGVVNFEGGERPFLLWFGAGYDAVVIEALHAARTSLMGVVGLVRRSPAVVSAMVRYSAPAIHVEVAGAALAVASSVMAANVREVAFGGIVAGAADPFDGRLDLVTVPPIAKSEIIGLGLGMLTSGLDRASGVRHGQVTEVTLSSEGRVPFQLDGEPVGTLPVAIRIRPRAVSLLLT
jgi:diacylglycerol kinase family enzyme